MAEGELKHKSNSATKQGQGLHEIRNVFDQGHAKSDLWLTWAIFVLILESIKVLQNKINKKRKKN